MPAFIARLISTLRSRVRGWRAALTVTVFVFLTSWLAMWLVEPDSNGLTDPGTYWWYFLITASTVGYGDYFPETVLGRLVATYVIIGGIVTLTILFTELATHIQSLRSKRLKGMVDVDLGDHIVLLGYTPVRTERLVDQLHLEDAHDLVLCAWEDTPEHPMPERDGVRFVRGDLAQLDVLRRAGVERARTVVVDARDDNEALVLALSIDHLRPDIHLVVALRDMDHCERLRYVNSKAQCVQWHMPNLLKEEALDPGITEVYSELMDSAGCGNTYSVRLADGQGGRTFGDWQAHFGRRFAATVVAVRQDGRMAVSPPWAEPVHAGAVLYYVSQKRVDAAQLAPETPTTPAQRTA
ncbi:ion channel [Streptomyces sp. WMMC897]|uniref:ion channel n=1 Tax=Streptomyces sp. WMMC897 TaxID=3014782 RepID=UPI0022B6DEA8|nr:ion channel [Streptomyces sp. WMMC897]MCZ7415422.1 ion channel [Streptomyces sp. WMMC897]MCZ7417844.1 ion channel [Streptomyces sp. WMMC897]MCZ7417870.1 ion channel [Streptomyces sp. WMMC897]